NQTKVSVFILESVPNTAQFPLLFFIIFMVIYLLTVLGNLIILVTIVVESHLSGLPMYFFLCNLSLLDTCLSSVTVPQILVSFIAPSHRTISFGSCVLQLYTFHFLASTECFLYTVMAYDHYLAICHPLNYTTLMNRRISLGLITATWFTGSFHAAIHTSLTFRLPYYGPSWVNYFFCDIPPVLKLACANITVNHAVIRINIALVGTGCFLLICISYSYIASVFLKIQTMEERHRAFSTCSAHLTVVLLYYSPSIFIYMHPASSNAMYGMLAVFYAIITPMLNPFIYMLRNKEVKRSL
uniref:Olfactory receptor family 10 subfamily S member 1 n=2 Tax=Pseudonaja textilis TaxID=8673 RepID=A0A670Z1K6_PSETE